MTKKTNDTSDFDLDVYDDPDPSASKQLDESAYQESERDEDRDSNAFAVDVKTAIFNGAKCVKFYAHRHTQSYENEDMAASAVLLARVSERELTMFPLDANSARDNFLQPKYDELTSITILPEEGKSWRLPNSLSDLEVMLDKLPTGFARRAIFGLGLRWEYRLIPEAILELDGVTQLVIEPGDGASSSLPVFRLGVDRFTRIRKAIDSITNRASSRSLKARKIAAYNETLHVALPSQFEQRFPVLKPGEIYELVQLHGRASRRSAKDGIAAAQVVREDAQKIASEEPSKLFELKTVIEQVTLAHLIGEFDAMLQKNLLEPKWQTFFKANPFILGLAFPNPVILLQDQASVGGTTIRGNGESIVDFLMAQRFTGNLVIIEIKRPATTLVERKAYRGDLRAPPGTDRLNGAGTGSTGTVAAPLRDQEIPGCRAGRCPRFLGQLHRGSRNFADRRRATSLAGPFPPFVEGRCGDHVRRAAGEA